jgi:hypothetical protein
MGSRKKQKLFQGINNQNRYYYPKSRSDTNIFSNNNPTNYVIDIFGNDMSSDTDYYGSYTGVPKDGTIVPVQDADDL